MKIGFVGLGKMGSPMAQNLLRAGHELTVYNRTPEKAKALAQQGARVATSPVEAARDSEAVFTMLSDDRALEEVTFANDGVLAGLSKGATHISSSTAGTKITRSLSEAHYSRGQEFVAAPVFGRPQAAESKQLVVVAAGKKYLFDRHQPLFEAIGRRTFLVGSEPWQANLFKLLGNFMIMTVIETFGEAFAAVRKADFDHHQFLDVMNELFGSPVYKNYGQAIADEKFSPSGFAFKLGLKDIQLAMEAAAEFDAPLPIASLIRDNLISGLANGHEQLDLASLALVAARHAGLEQRAVSSQSA
ncbi:MAG TPA: NAD(P)-dependent oxidoreductase [Bryobacteraceae bacterium]|nr:NAD(P)-dependent oxidoreductase [Bryobacteraceae bacterium]